MRAEKIEYKGQIYTVSQLAKMTGLKRSTLVSRLGDGWSIERIMNTPRLSRSQSGQLGAKAMLSGHVSLTRP